MFQSRSVEETGLDATMAEELAFVRRRFELVRLAGQEPSATEALNSQYSRRK